VKARADPQVAALYLTSSQLPTVKAAVMGALCLATGLIIGLGNALLFSGNTKKMITAEAEKPAVRLAVSKSG
jgi:hypothetical protein